MKCFHIHLTVSGDSKGFRFEVMQKALKSKIYGYIQRKGEDEFFLVAEGKEDKLEDFIKWLDEGFHWTKIVDGKIEEGSIENYSTFDMRNIVQENNKMSDSEKDNK